MKTILLKDVRDRESDPKTQENAIKKVKDLISKLDPQSNKMERLIKQSSQETTPKRKLQKIRELINVINDSLQGVSACRSGCSQCCHIPVLMTQTEADIIAEEIGVTAKNPSYIRESNMALVGQPCTFLKDTQCSIYESRPLACRLCHNMDEDALLCELFPGEKISVPYFDGSRYEFLWLQGIGLRDGKQLAHLTDFFPLEGVVRD